VTFQYAWVRFVLVLVLVLVNVSVNVVGSFRRYWLKTFNFPIISKLSFFLINGTFEYVHGGVHEHVHDARFPPRILTS
jgi:hypothetical protein